MQIVQFSLDDTHAVTQAFLLLLWAVDDIVFEVGPRDVTRSE